MTKYQLSGQTFGLLTVLSSEPRITRTGRTMSGWRCACACGTEKVVPTGHLMRGAVKSCGCMSATWKRQNATRHGQYGTPTHTSWIDMMRRVRNPNCKHWKHYGGRGITVCERWTDFASFREDMGDKPGRAYELERIDNEGNYEPKNCKWATRKEQMANTRASVKITVGDETLVQEEWARRTGVSSSLIIRRRKLGYTDQEAATLPPTDTRRYIAINGDKRNLDAWALESGLSKMVIRRRLALGWTPEDAVGIPLGAAKRKY